MKHIRITLAALLVAGGATVVAAQQSQPPVAHQHGQRGVAAGRGPGARGQLLRGIKLSDAEKASLKTVREKYAPQMKALHEQYKPQHQALRQARQNHDTVALRKLWEQNAAEREATKKLMEAERVDLRAALSPENQTKFDANVARLEKRMAQRPDSARKPFGRRPGGRGPRG